MKIFDLPLILSFGSFAGKLRIEYNSNGLQTVKHYIADWDQEPTTIPVCMLQTTLFEPVYKEINSAIKNNQ